MQMWVALEITWKNKRIQKLVQTNNQQIELQHKIKVNMVWWLIQVLIKY